MLKYRKLTKFVDSMPKNIQKMIKAIDGHTYN